MITEIRLGIQRAAKVFIVDISLVLVQGCVEVVIAEKRSESDMSPPVVCHFLSVQPYQVPLRNLPSLSSAHSRHRYTEHHKTRDLDLAPTIAPLLDFCWGYFGCIRATKPDKINNLAEVLPNADIWVVPRIGTMEDGGWSNSKLKNEKVGWGEEVES